MNENLTEIRTDSSSPNVGVTPTPPKVSVIVPVYKVEKYLPECIESVLAQTFTDFELILVDDGSPDNSGKICDDYAARDPRIRVFHKENGGVSSARNLGLDNARGEWVAFVDGDDLLKPRMFSECASFFCEFYVDLILCGIEFFDTRTLKIKHRFSPHKRETKSSGGQVFCEFYEAGLLNSPYCKFFRQRFLAERNLHFKEGVALGEDTLFVCHVFQTLQKIATIPQCLYRVRRGHESAISRFSETALDVFSCMVNAIKKIPGIEGDSAMYTRIASRMFGIVSSQMAHPNCTYSWRKKILMIKNAMELSGVQIPMGKSIFKFRTRNAFLVFAWEKVFSSIVSLKRTLTHSV